MEAFCSSVSGGVLFLCERRRTRRAQERDPRDAERRNSTQSAMQVLDGVHLFRERVHHALGQ
jgi:hypothetical protein